eukprot:TRINITY_DN296_c0_g1_i3.p1 TRINITY_DN296_c0_g1~~TRINITY_DN296_c0_g1_i3.p1  ORF type:complete len:622 (+),score=181.21 TRINITY_DN296_c0_g1_i3:213-1868(+)
MFLPLAKPAPASMFSGRTTTPHKEGMQLLTGTELPGSHPEIPGRCLRPLVELGRVLDATSSRIVEVLSGEDGVFRGGSAEEVGRNADLPLLGGGERRYGMLDAVWYKPRAKGRGPAVVVGEHTDPGLFVLSVVNTAAGLEIRDETGEWRAIPPGKGVMWCGDAAVAASGGTVPAAPHRVSAGATARLGVWHEICTATQLSLPYVESLQKQGLELQLGDIRGTKAVLQALRDAESHRKPAPTKGMTVVPLGGDAERAGYTAPRRSGVPVGKSGVVRRPARPAPTSKAGEKPTVPGPMRRVGVPLTKSGVPRRARAVPDSPPSSPVSSTGADTPGAAALQLDLLGASPLNIAGHVGAPDTPGREDPSVASSTPRANMDEDTPGAEELMADALPLQLQQQMEKHYQMRSQKQPQRWQQVGVPMSKSGPMPFQQQPMPLQFQPEMGVPKQMKAMQMSQPEMGVPMSKSGPMPHELEQMQQLQMQRLQMQQMKAMQMSQPEMGVPMSKSGPMPMQQMMPMQPQMLPMQQQVGVPTSKMGPMPPQPQQVPSMLNVTN